MACNCSPETRTTSPEPSGTRYEVLSAGRVVFRSPDSDQADTVAARWPGGTVRPVDGSTPYSDT
ncbi:hypothetical protein [Streptomyces arboris]|uniref:hypothetical protein n=1 Tax=Streptomyces arboris TaxID=2600619 RepID=UPI003BF57682